MGDTERHRSQGQSLNTTPWAYPYVIGPGPTVPDLMKKLFAIGLLTLVCGCVPFRQNGTTHYLILGVGLVSVNSTNQPVATVVKANVLGIMGSTMPGPKLTVGYAASTVATVATNQNVIVETGGPGRTINIQSFK